MDACRAWYAASTDPRVLVPVAFTLSRREVVGLLPDMLRALPPPGLKKLYRSLASRHGEGGYLLSSLAPDVGLSTAYARNCWLTRTLRLLRPGALCLPASCSTAAQRDATLHLRLFRSCSHLCISRRYRSPLVLLPRPSSLTLLLFSTYMYHIRTSLRPKP